MDNWNVLKFIVLKSVKYIRTHIDIIKYSYSECSISMVTCDQGAMSLDKGQRFGTDKLRVLEIEQKLIVHI